MIDRSEPTTYGEWLAARRDPMRNVDAFGRALRLRFDCGGDDDAVPVVGAEGFELAVRSRVEHSHVEISVHPGLTHREVCSDEVVVRGVLDWLTADV